MSTIEKIRSTLIEKIRSITDQEYLEALDHIVSGTTDDGPKKLKKEQIELLELSEVDMKQGNLISHEAMFKRNQEWFNGK